MKKCKHVWTHVGWMGEVKYVSRKVTTRLLQCRKCKTVKIEEDE